MNSSLEFINSIEKLRKKLLDLTGRNNSISFRHKSGSKKQIRFVDEIADEIFDKLLKENELTICGLPVPDLEPEDEKNEDFKKLVAKQKKSDEKYLQDLEVLGENSNKRKLLAIEFSLRDRIRAQLGMTPVERNKRPNPIEYAKSLGINPSYDLGNVAAKNKHSHDCLRTLIYEDEQELMLDGLIDQRKLLESETGTEPLFLAIGFLEWFEADSSDKSMTSPLLFLPISITKEKDEKKQKYFYSISLRDTEIYMNFSLQERFKRDFDINLPEIEIEDEEGTSYLRPSVYFAKVKEIIKEKQDWSIKNWTTLSFFSFTKLAMYQELEAQSLEQIIHPDSPLNDVILGTDAQRSDVTFADDYNLESNELKAKVPHLISIADTSQISAIIDATDGKNIVIEGPPGTGKSQTITNMIASLVDAGKKVLFIAEKRAALTVVNDRLTQCGLGEFCLELHSGKSKKAEILKSLSERLETEKTPNRVKLSDLLNQIESVKQKINAYLNFLHSTYEPLDKSLQEIMWTLLLLKDKFADLDSRVGVTQVNQVNDISKWENDEIEMALHSFSQDFTNFIAKFGSEQKHPWYGLVSDRLLSINLAKFKADMNLVYEKLPILNKEYENIFNQSSDNLNKLILESKLKEISDVNVNVDLELDWVVPLIKQHEDNLFSRLEQAKALFEKKEELVTLLKTFSKDEYGNLKPDMISALGNIISENSYGDYDLSEIGSLKRKLEREMQEMDAHQKNLLNYAEIAFETAKKENSSEHLNSINKLVEHHQIETADLVSSLKYFDQLNKYIQMPGPRDSKSLRALLELTSLISNCPRDSWNLKNVQFFDLSKTTQLKKICIEGLELFNKGENFKKKMIFDDLTDSRILRKVSFELRNSNILSFLSSDYRNAKRKSLDFLKYNLHPKDNAQLLEALADFLDTKQDFAKKIENNIGLEFENVLKSKEDISGILNWISYAEDIKKFIVKFELNQEFSLDIFNLEPTKIDGIKSSSSQFMYLKNSQILQLCEGKDISIFKDELVDRFEATKQKNENDYNARTSNIHTDYEKKVNSLIERAKSSSSVNKSKLAVLESVLKIGSDLKIYEDKKLFVCDEFVRHLQDLLHIDIKLNQVPLNSFENEKEKVLGLLSSENFEELKKLYALKKIMNLDFIKFVEAISYGIKNWIGLIQISQNSISEILVTIEDIGKRHRIPYLIVDNVNYNQIVSKIKNAFEHESEINGLVQYLQSKATLEPKKKYLANILSLISKEEDLVPHVGKIYQLCYYVGIVTEFANQNPVHFKSVSNTFEEFRNKFRSLDDQLTKTYRIELSNRLLDNPVPSGISKGKKSEYSDLGLIDYQIKLKRPNVSVRSLMKRSGDAIQSLKPIFLMSPLSVAQLLPNNIKFDVVIMDEASQLRPEDAIGSIARAKQVVIVGDPKQMPPSDFFNKTIDDDAPEENEEDYVDIKEESILDLGLSTFRPARRLKWHYRSRSEELIAFSNYHFYENDLIIFPAASKDTHPIGVNYKKVEHSVYNKGLNPIEAKQVVDEAVSLIHQYPNKTMMIVAVNKAQSELIQELLNEVEKNDVIVEQYRGKHEDSLEPLIVRNLENVQGDERDIVIISTVYGPDANGHMFQRFGPINSEYGHRRLNVLFTRAKYHMLVVSSLDPENIVVSDTSKQGVVAFKNFLSFVKTKRLGAEITFTDREPDSDFERFVAMKLRHEMPELKIVPQVGVAGFFVDIGIRHPKKEGTFLLGIECDGKTYHSAKSARDRDKIRQKVLEDLGWNIHRIWSTDWFNDPDLQINKLVDKIKFLLSKEI